MKVNAIRRITNDSNHNAFTGACFFKGALFVAFRQGDSHADEQGRIIVMRSRDEGVSFDTVYVARGTGDTRDANLYTDGQTLFCNAFTATPAGIRSGACTTQDGLIWTSYREYKGTDFWRLWRPVYFQGTHYCPACDQNVIGWFESKDGFDWKVTRVIYDVTQERPNEAVLAIKPNGEAAILLRREHASKRPLLLTGAAPFTAWKHRELEIPLVGPMAWWVNDDLWISGRWMPRPKTAHLAVFKVGPIDSAAQPEFEMVFPSGPEFDCSYMAAAAHPSHKGRFFMSFYSNALAHENPAISQWHHPDIYVADVLFGGSYIQDWRVSDLQYLPGLHAASYPAEKTLTGWHDVKALDAEKIAAGFVSAKSIINKTPGVVYFVSDIEVGPRDTGTLFLGYDGPVRVWLNGTEVFSGNGSNPAVPDKTVVAVKFKHGTNRLAIALDTNHGKANGIFARFEASATG
jgi:hypothetical protein